MKRTRANRFRQALAWIMGPGSKAIVAGAPNRKAKRDLARTLRAARPKGPARKRSAHPILGDT